MQDNLEGVRESRARSARGRFDALIVREIKKEGVDGTWFVIYKVK